MAQRRSDLRRTLKRRVLELKELRDEKRILEDRIAVTQEEVLDGLDDLAIKSLTFTHDEQVEVKGTKVEGSTLEFDVAKLRKRLGSGGWQKVSTRTLDRAKLESAVAAGDIDPRIIAECSSEKHKKPYIRITEKRLNSA